MAEISAEYYSVEVETNNNQEPAVKSTFEKASYYTLLILTFFLPIFFLPGNFSILQVEKMTFLGAGVLLAFLFWAISKLKSGRLTIPTNSVFYASGLILLFSLISTLFSGSLKESFAGVLGETSTFFFLLAMFLTLFVSFEIFQTKGRILSFYVTLVASFTVLLVYQLLRLFFGADFLDFNVFNSTTSSLLNRWNDLGIIFGFITLISVAALGFLSINKLFKILLSVFILLSLFLISIVNSLLVWVTLAVFSLVLFVYSYHARVSNSSGLNTKGFSSFPKLPLLIFVISIIFIILRPQMGNFALERFNISQLEARPSFTSTLLVAEKTLTQSPGFGVGSNRFSVAWGLHKPINVNNTIFWDTNFNYGIGFVPTFLVTGGVLGLLSWIFFLGAIIFLGFRSIFSKIKISNFKPITTSSFISLLYLWVFSVISVPGIVTLFLTFILTGVFLSSLASDGFLKSRVISFSGDSKAGFISVFAVILSVILSLALLYMVFSKFVSSVYANKALLEAGAGNLDKSLEHINKAIAIRKTDNNYRLASQIHMERLNEFFGNAEASADESNLPIFQEILGEAISNAQAATRADSADYRNWLTLGNIYEAITPLGVQGAYESAKNTYERAGVANPTNPAVDLSLARLEAINGNNQGARVKINDSLQKKNNYTNAIFLLSQIEINEGNLNEAVAAVEAASLLTPNDPVTFFQLGFLKSNQGDFEGAVQALERAVILNPPYSNAKYFLGLSYYALGRTDEAILQFEDIEVLNPDNQEVKIILQNLRGGLAPLQGLSSGAGEEIEALPIEE